LIINGAILERSRRAQNRTYLILLLVFISCSEFNEKKEPSDKLMNNSVDEKLVILNDKTDLFLISGNNSEFWIPSGNDFKQINAILEKAIQNGEFDFLKDPKLENIKKYYRQYVCYQNNNKERIVFINAFCENLELLTGIEGEIIMKPFDWQNKLLIVDDGGMCYWSIKINLSTKEYFDFYVNGEA
jgi:hypothetical protein